MGQRAPFEEVVGALTGARCLVLGAGGAARAVVFGLAARGARVSVANRSASKAVSLAQAAGATAVDFESATTSPGPFDVVVNATSGGMDQGEHSARLPLDPGAIPPGAVVMDIVYKPIETALLAAARARGARVIHGGRMLLHQAARQLELYTGVDAPLSAMDDALTAAMLP